MSALPDVNTGEFGGHSRIRVLHVVVAFGLSALPAVAATAFAPTTLAETNQAFIALYVVTLPWSLALCAVTAGFAGGWFGPDERVQVLAASAILLVSAVVGRAIAPGSSVDEHFHGGSTLVVASEAIVFGVIGYALVYGWPMWIASFFVAAFVGWWVRHRRLREDFVDVAIAPPALTARVVRTSPSPSPAGAAIAGRPSTLPPVMPQRAPASPPHEELASLTKAELYERARARGVKGRSAMSKAQLLTALRGSP